MRNAGEHGNNAKCKKTCKLNVAKKQKTYKRYEAREKLETLSKAIKHGKLAQREKIWNRRVGKRAEVNFSPDGLKTEPGCSYW